MLHFLWFFLVCYNMCDSGWGFWPLTGLSPTKPTSLKAAEAADRDIDKTLPCSGWKMSLRLPPCIPPTPRPGDLQPHPQQTSPQPARWACSTSQETTNTNPFPEGSSQNQLLGVVFTNKAALRLNATVWGLHRSRAFSVHYGQDIGKLGKPLGKRSVTMGTIQDQASSCITLGLLQDGDAGTQHTQRKRQTPINSCSFL